MPDRNVVPWLQNVERRRLLQTAGFASLAGLLPRAARAADAPTLVTSIRSLSNPYHAIWKEGADAFAKAVGLQNVTLVSEGNSEKSIADIRAMIAKTNGNMVLNCDPNDTPDARPVAEICSKAGVYLVTQWNKPTDLHPWDFNPYYVSHIEFNGVRSGREIAEMLFKAMGGSGGFVALGGMISTTAAIERRRGLDLALKANPNMKLLDFQTGELEVAGSLRHHQRLAHPLRRQDQGHLGGQRRHGRGRAGGAAGRGAGRKSADRRRGRDQGGGRWRAQPASSSAPSRPTRTGRAAWGSRSPLAAKRGVFDPAKEPHLHREFYAQVTEITKANVAEYIKTQVQAHPVLDYKDLWGRVVGPIVYS